MKQKKIDVLVSLIALLGATTLLTGTAMASHVNCGDVITADTTLDADVGPCSAGGVVFGADFITLNLNGHRIFGTSAVLDDAGVDTNGFSGVKVMNGTVSDFDAGVVVRGVGSFGAEVTGIRAENNIGGNTTDYGDGILVLDSATPKIHDNVVVNNGPYDGIGLLGAVEGGEVYDNEVRDNVADFSPGTFNQNDGIRVEASPVTPKPILNRVYNNVATGNGLDGIAVFQGVAHAVVENNIASSNGRHTIPGASGHHTRQGDGIRLFTPAVSTVQNNTVCDNGGNGIVTGFAAGIPGSGTGAHTILNNDVGVGTAGCTANATGGLSTDKDLKDTFMSNSQVSGWPGEDCIGNTWHGNYTAGDTFNHPCVTNNSEADVSVTKTASPAAAVGDDVSYALTAMNNGPNKADSVTVTDTLPAGMSFASASAGCTNAGGTVTCAMGTLASGASASATIVVSPTAAGSYTNTATVSASQPDPTPGNNSSSASTSVTNPRGCTIVGTGGDDALSGTLGNDVICGLAGNDTMSGLDGDDTVYSGSGNDTANGNEGKDTLSGGSGNDSLNGGNAADTLQGVDGVSGNDSLDGGNGPDTCASDPGDTQVSC